MTRPEDVERAVEQIAAAAVRGADAMKAMSAAAQAFTDAAQAFVVAVTPQEDPRHEF